MTLSIPSAKCWLEQFGQEAAAALREWGLRLGGLRRLSRQHLVHQNNGGIGRGVEVNGVRNGGNSRLFNQFTTYDKG